MEQYRFAPHQKRLGEAERLQDTRKRAARVAQIGPLDRIGETYKLLFNLAVTDEERKELTKLDERWVVAALILKCEAVFCVESDMNPHELARTLGFTKKSKPRKVAVDAVWMVNRIDGLRIIYMQTIELPRAK